MSITHLFAFVTYFRKKNLTFLKFFSYFLHFEAFFGQKQPQKQLFRNFHYNFINKLTFWEFRFLKKYFADVCIVAVETKTRKSIERGKCYGFIRTIHFFSFFNQWDELFFYILSLLHGCLPYVCIRVLFFNKIITISTKKISLSAFFNTFPL